MPANNDIEPFDWSFGSIGRHFVIWLLMAAAPILVLWLWFLAVTAFPDIKGTRVVCAVTACVMLWLVPFVFSFERTGVIPLDALACLINEAVMLFAFFLAFLISALGKGPLHTDAFMGVVLLLALYSVVMMLVNWFVTRKRQLSRRNRRKKAKAEAEPKTEVETAPETKAEVVTEPEAKTEAEPKPEETALK